MRGRNGSSGPTPTASRPLPNTRPPDPRRSTGNSSPSRHTADGSRESSSVDGDGGGAAHARGRGQRAGVHGRVPGPRARGRRPGPGVGVPRSRSGVSAGTVSLAIGSQTSGSTIRLASSCGVWGFKPTHGLIPRPGMFMLSRTCDHVGLIARTVEDLALLAEPLVAFVERDLDTRPRARVPFVEVVGEEPPLPPIFAFVKTPQWRHAAEDTKAAFAELVEKLGDRVEEVELFPSALEAWSWHEIISGAEMAMNLELEWEKGRDRLSDHLRARIERGRHVQALDYLRALSRLRPVYGTFREIFEQRYDANLTPAAPGTAPKGLASTGEPVFSTLWTLCGMPAVSVPLMQGENGLPLGVQLVGPRDGDARLLRTARWLVGHVAK